MATVKFVQVQAKEQRLKAQVEDTNQARPQAQAQVKVPKRKAVLQRKPSKAHFQRVKSAKIRLPIACNISLFLCYKCNNLCVYMAMCM